MGYTTSISGRQRALTEFLRTTGYEKKLSTIARTLVERLLPYFITKDYKGL